MSLPPKNFFGLTHLGPPNIFASSLRRRECHHRINPDSPEAQSHDPPAVKTSISKVPDWLFHEAFLDKASDIPSRKVRRVHVPELIEKVVGRKLDMKENEVLLRCFDIGDGHMTAEEFAACLKSFQSCECCAAEECGSSSYRSTCGIPQRISNMEIVWEKDKNKRDKFGPMDVLQHPITDSQAYGWGVGTTRGPTHPRRQMDVTKSEGICLDSYYNPI